MPASVLILLATLAVSPFHAENPSLQESQLRIVWDLHVSERTSHVTDWLAEQGWCWAIEVPPHVDPALVLPLREQGFSVVGQIHAHPVTRDWHWTRKGMAAPDLNAFVDLMRQANPEHPRIQFFMEDDSAGVGFSKAFLETPPRDHAHAMEMFNAYLRRAMGEIQHLEDIERWAMAGFAGTCHHYARNGAECIIVERANDDIEDLQTAVAFARGASRQFGCHWGIDLSLWWGVIYGCVQDLPASFYTRHLWLSYMSGAQVFRIEGGDLLVRPEGPTEVARAVDAFARKAKRLEPGAADTPVAVMLPVDHGWMTPAYWRTTNESWNYARLPYRQGDKGVDGFFGTAFPGSIYAQDPFPKGAYKHDDPPASPFALSCVTPEFAVTAEQVYQAEPPVPFGQYSDRNRARQDFLENRIDPSPYRPMGDSRWGDIIDVLTDDASPETLESYPVLAILGQVTLTDVLRDRLHNYVRRGGTLIMAAGVATPDDDALCGFRILPELRVGRAWKWRDGPVLHEPFRYCPALVPEASEVLTVSATTPDGVPLVIAHRLGEGTVHTCLLPWFEGGNAPLAGPALRLFDDVIHAVQPVFLEGSPAAWLSTRGTTSDHRTLVIANHNEYAWEGTATVRDVPEYFTQCFDIITGQPLTFSRQSSDVILDARIAPFGVFLARWQCAEE